MGRTLHYTVTKDKGNFTKHEAETMFKVSQFANAEPKLWTCESFWLDPYDYYPYWNNRGGRAIGWDQINARYDKIKASGKSHIEICKQLHKEKLIMWRNEGNFSVARGFTKVQGNELNSLMVFTALIAISQQCPNVKITLHDEGEFLYCDLIIRKGRVIPDLSDLKGRIESWAASAYFSSQTKEMKEIRKDILSGFDKDGLRELGLDGSYGKSAAGYLKKYLNKAKYIFHLVKECWNRPDVQVNTWNLSNSDPKHWFDPEIWHRPVDIEKFKDYKMSAATLMDGFNGEGFGLAEDAEGTSYKQIALIQNMLTKAGFEKENVQILGTE